jgi:hypothetical protein
LPLRVDLSGRLLGWYRLELNGRPLPPEARISELDPEQPLGLRFVANRSLMARVEVSASPLPLRFAAPVGSAVPVGSLVDHLIIWLGLPEGDWELCLAGRPLEPHAILDGRVEGDAPVDLLLRLAEGA